MTRQHPPTISIIIPCYNEEAILDFSISELLRKLNELITAKQISSYSYLFFIDDGSSDDTWRIICRASEESDQVFGCKLSRNFGHQNALMAGINCCAGNCDAIISVDGDLQQDIEVLDQFVEAYRKGSEIVFGVRKSRSTDTRLKAITATSFYLLMKLCGVSLLRNHADYRLLGPKAIEALLLHSESETFLRAQCYNLGFPTDTVYFDVKKRLSGKSKYTIRKMLSLSLTGITSFSILPLRFIAILGFMVFLGAVAMTLYVFGIYFIFDEAVPGWASTVLPIYFLGGTQILCLGVVAEYLAQVYKETKKRPSYIIESHLCPPSR